MLAVSHHAEYQRTKAAEKHHLVREAHQSERVERGPTLNLGLRVVVRGWVAVGWCTHHERQCGQRGDFTTRNQNSP